jgi:UDP-2,3-diacylglucosamine pyrophosphatase LpxH
LLLVLRHKSKNKADKVYMVGDAFMVKALKNSSDWAQDIKDGHIVPVEGKI